MHNILSLLADFIIFLAFETRPTCSISSRGDPGKPFLRESATSRGHFAPQRTYNRKSGTRHTFSVPEWRTLPVFGNKKQPQRSRISGHIGIREQNRSSLFQNRSLPIRKILRRQGRTCRRRWRNISRSVKDRRGVAGKRP